MGEGQMANELGIGILYMSRSLAAGARITQAEIRLITLKRSARAAGSTHGQIII